MFKSLVRRLGLDLIGDVVADEVRRAQVEVLREERDVLAGMIAKLYQRIAGFGGKRRGRPPRAASTSPTPPAATRRPRRRRRVLHAPGQTLRDMVVKALSKARAPVTAKVLIGLVRRLGYKAAAKPSTLLTSIYHVLADKKVFRRLGKGVVGLAAAPATPRNDAKPRKLGRRATGAAENIESKAGKAKRKRLAVVKPRTRRRTSAPPRRVSGAKGTKSSRPRTPSKRPAVSRPRVPWPAGGGSAHGAAQLTHELLSRSERLLNGAPPGVHPSQETCESE